VEPSSEPPAAGRLDLHSHLLPGIDDGCRTLDDSFACVRQLLAHGYVGTVCTPHVILDTFPNNVPDRIAEAVVQLQEQLYAAGLEYWLWAGGELRIHADTIHWLESAGVPTLGPSRAVLIDWWGSDWPDFADEVCDYLIQHGYQPILAHPERMGLQPSELERVIDSLEQRGIRLQGNFNSVAGAEGPTASAWVQRLLAADRYYLMALDMHGPDSLGSRLTGLKLLESQIGRARVAEYLEIRTREVLFGRRSGIPA
jgi:protein-tyrosine phosphatase